MLQKLLRNKKSRIAIFAGTGFLIIVLLIYFLFFRNKIQIVFNEDFKEIEFGDKVELKDLIEEKSPEDIKIKYPDIELKEVGNYHLSFQYDVNGKKGNETFEVIIKDTAIPHFKLKINKKAVEVLVNSAYNPLSNIKSMDNLSEESIKNQIKVDKKEYEKLKKEIKNTNKKLNQRIISKAKDIKSYDTFRNGLIYYTDLDLSKEGIYEVIVLAVDENYNVTEKSWKIKVVPEGSIVNSGGTVVCGFNGDSSNTEAYTSRVTEKYTYDEHKLVSKYELVTTMIFNEEYQTIDNIDKLVQALDNQYSSWKDNQGVSVTIENDSTTTVTVRIVVDFANYDMKKDPLNVLVEKDGSSIKIQKVLDDAEKNKFSCTVQ